MGNEVVTVVDDGIIVGGVVITVVITHVEVGHVAQVAVGIIGNLDQIATHLSEKDGAVADGLQLVENANDTVDGVRGTVQVVFF